MAAQRRSGILGQTGALRLAAAAILAAAASLASPPVFSQAADPAPGSPPDPAPSPTRGQYLLDAAGCAACHTDVKNRGPRLAGGRRLKTPFGVFVSPNITPDPETGIGNWSDANFIQALRLGIAPDGRHYFPVFPYTSYTRITDRDLLDIKAYLFTLAPVVRANRPHEAGPPFGWRFLVGPWKRLFFTAGPFRPDRARDAEWNRGAYLVTALGHCGECHTPRNFLGAARDGMALAGTPEGPEGGPGAGIVPNITPDPETGIGKWSDADLLSLLKIGMLPNADFVGGAMGEVVDETTGRLTDADRRAVIRYLRGLPPVHHRVESKKDKKKSGDDAY